MRILLQLVGKSLSNRQLGLTPQSPFLKLRCHGATVGLTLRRGRQHANTESRFCKILGPSGSHKLFKAVQGVVLSVHALCGSFTPWTDDGQLGFVAGNLVVHEAIEVVRNRFDLQVLVQTALPQRIRLVLNAQRFDSPALVLLLFYFQT